MRVAFTVDTDLANDMQRFRSVSWDAVVAAAIRTKLKMLRQTGEPVPPVYRDPFPWVAVAAPTQVRQFLAPRKEYKPEVGARPKPTPTPKPVRSTKWPKLPKKRQRPMPSPEEIQRRRELLQTMR